MGPQELGAIGEVYVARMLRLAGMKVAIGAGPADLLADGVPVEVKAARVRPYRSRRGLGFQFCLRKTGHTDHRRAAVMVMLAYWDESSEPVAFVIPTGELGERRKVVIPRAQPELYEGQWARWRGRWETIVDVMEGCDE